MKSFILLLLLLSASVPLFAQEGARDAMAVLNRCGKPLKGDDTVFTNADSHRTLLYERGTLLFDRVGDNGWKFVSGSHKKQKNLSADQMAVFMGPCLKLALADSAAPAPIKKETPCTAHRNICEALHQGSHSVRSAGSRDPRRHPLPVFPPQTV